MRNEPQWHFYATDTAELASLHYVSTMRKSYATGKVLVMLAPWTSALKLVGYDMAEATILVEEFLEVECVT